MNNERYRADNAALLLVDHQVMLPALLAGDEQG